MSDPAATSRRDFLRGRSAVQTIRRIVDETHLAADADEAATPDPSVYRAYLLQVSRSAMACQFTVYLNAGQYAAGTEKAIAALDLVDRLEDQLSVYRPGSELSLLNQHAAERPVAAEAGLFELLRLALEIGRETDGAFDITSGPLSKAWGFFRRKGRFPDAKEISNALAQVGARQVRLDEEQRTVAFDLSGVEVNVNGIGKGYALDRAAEQLRAAGLEHFLIHGGQSSVLASGSHAAREGGGWSVGLRHPLRPERRLAEFFLKDRALGTSGAGTQHFHFNGKRYGHVIDPRSGMPADGVYSATVLAPSAAAADALATAFYVLGPVGTGRDRAAHDDVSAVLVTPAKREGSIEFHAFGLHSEDWNDYTRER